MIEIERDISLLKEATTPQEFVDLLQLCSWIDNTDIKEHGLVGSEELLSSAETYYHISKLMPFKEELIVVDCGSCIPIWQYFFRDCRKYIAIDRNCEFEKYIKPIKNAEFIKGDIVDVLPKIREEYNGQKLFGISNLCISYFSTVNPKLMEEFDKTFRFKYTG